MRADFETVKLRSHETKDYTLFNQFRNSKEDLHIYVDSNYQDREKHVVENVRGNGPKNMTLKIKFTKTDVSDGKSNELRATMDPGLLFKVPDLNLCGP